MTLQVSRPGHSWSSHLNHLGPFRKLLSCKLQSRSPSQPQSFTSQNLTKDLMRLVFLVVLVVQIRGFSNYVYLNTDIPSPYF